ncbi:MAG: ribonuclease P protein component [Bacteroidaceae bacterium]|nr:ribonuclease P protein component [Bacteroidaceae bacterium]
MSENFFFPKTEKLCSDKLIDRLFTEGNREIGSFPVRLVYLQVSTEEISGINILVSVSKRHFKRAVKRNRVKRQLREYYRLNNQKLKSMLATNNQGLLLALIYTDGKLWSTEKLNKRLDSAFEKLLSVLSSKSEQS